LHNEELTYFVILTSEYQGDQIKKVEWWGVKHV
jgi:hypothetical protein